MQKNLIGHAELADNINTHITNDVHIFYNDYALTQLQALFIGFLYYFPSLANPITQGCQIIWRAHCGSCIFSLTVSVIRLPGGMKPRHF